MIQFIKEELKDEMENINNIKYFKCKWFLSKPHVKNIT